ncbi:MAG: hypothetical protein M2R45_01244 [Verrucomicrobia subdivision 3 bacterium]|nr:hypothetical protein [Limisphaerales bacterium]MCS1415115.1 hypothetical protein [Limisphaerales bacterium]
MGFAVMLWPSWILGDSMIVMKGGVAGAVCQVSVPGGESDGLGSCSGDVSSLSQALEKRAALVP